MESYTLHPLSTTAASSPLSYLSPPFIFKIIITCSPFDLSLHLILNRPITLHLLSSSHSKRHRPVLAGETEQSSKE